MLGVGVSFSVTSANFSFIYTLFWSHPEDLIFHIVSLKNTQLAVDSKEHV